MRILWTTVAVALLGASPLVHADVLSLPQDAAQSSAVPQKGMAMNGVLRQYGEPSRRHAPVGGSSPQQPPITRWDYPGFSVFFEYDHVVDSVIQGAPATVHNPGALSSDR